MLGHEDGARLKCCTRILYGSLAVKLIHPLVRGKKKLWGRTGLAPPPLFLLRTPHNRLRVRAFVINNADHRNTPGRGFCAIG